MPRHLSQNSKSKLTTIKRPVQVLVDPCKWCNGTGYNAYLKQFCSTCQGTGGTWEEHMEVVIVIEEVTP